MTSESSCCGRARAAVLEAGGFIQAKPIRVSADDGGVVAREAATEMVPEVCAKR